MKVVCDDRIPYIRPALERMADAVVFLPGSAIAREDLADADALVIRTRTKADRNLLEGTPVKIVITATIGYDHIDVKYLQQAGVAWSSCPGCNATSVAQYLHSTLLVLTGHADGIAPITNEHPVVGIVGCGAVGSQVKKALEPLALEILVQDPPKGLYCDLSKADIITYHTPITYDGPCPTHHLADRNFFASLTRKPIIINSARGGVVDETALLEAMDNGIVRAAVIDTWENEPNINLDLLRAALIATPHIAGYSADGKANASRMVMAKLSRFFGRPFDIDIAAPELPNRSSLPAEAMARALSLYNPMEDTARLKAAPQDFETQRGHYPLRREH